MSSVIRQPTNGRLSPTTMHWLISGWARSRSSSTAGATFLPPGGDDELLLPAGHAEEALVVQRADVAGVQPAVGVERLGGGLLVAPVAAEHDRAADQDLAVVGDPDRGPRDRQADRADLVAARPVHHRRGGGLGQAVALQHGDARAAEEVAEPLAERRAAGDRVRHLAADGRAQLGVDEPVEERVPEPQALAGARADRPAARRRLRTAVRDRGLGRGRGRSCSSPRWPRPAAGRS